PQTSYHWSYPSSDSEFYNLSSPETCIISPTSCMDFSLSWIRKNCSKNPSKQRQSASEKEKLRMRDLTKALHHLRTYLPPSVAPPEQTLTKIETLRLTISYISHLSAQLGLSEEALCQRKELNLNASGHHISPQQEVCQFNPSSSGNCWGEEAEIGRCAGQHQTLHHTATSTYPLHNTTGMERHPTSSEMCAYNDVINSSMDSLLESPVYVFHKDDHYQNIAQDFWI
uniref:Mesogenin-1-like n=1 Tax=Salmo trutta TaxID=8032 RepID=A0A673WBR7_SALTR